MPARIVVFLLSLMACLPGCFPTRETVRRTSEIPAGSRDQQEHSPATYVAFGELRATAGFSPEFPPDRQQQFREEARQAYLKAIQLDSKHLPAYLALARLQQHSGDHAGCNATYLQALQIAPKDASLWHDLGMCQCRQKFFLQAVNSFQKAVELSPQNRQYQNSLGFTLVLTRRIPEALKILTPIHGPATTHYNIARLMQHMQQPEEARHFAQLAFKHNPQLPGLQELLQEVSGKPRQAIQTAEFKQTTGAPLPQPTLLPQQPANSSPQAPQLFPAELTGANVLSPQKANSAVSVTTLSQPEKPQRSKSIHLPPRPVIPAELLGK